MPKENKEKQEEGQEKPKKKGRIFGDPEVELHY